MTTTIVIPCFNEADRLSLSDLEALCTSDGVSLLLVNDGSTDGTLEILQSVTEKFSDSVTLLDLKQNSGKAKAVQAGLLQAIDTGAASVGFLDADFATDAQEMLRLIGIFATSDTCQVLLASRWLHLGVDIRRSAFRHYLGRVYATMASMILGMPVYDTQCGAKLFEVNDQLKSALAQPLHCNWSFDVELIGRLKRGCVVDDTTAAGYEDAAFLEVPLERWVDVKGSKVRLSELANIVAELIFLWRTFRCLRRRQRTAD